MKKSPIILLLFFAMFNTACQKNNVRLCCVFPNLPDTYILAEKNNKAWLLKDNSGTIKTDSVRIYGTYYETNLEETFGFKIKFTGKGDYTLVDNKGLLGDNNGYYYNTVGQDVIVSKYKLNNTFQNKVTITNYDESTKIIEGTFQIKFSKTNDSPADSYPDDITLLNGKFKVALHN